MNVSMIWGTIYGDVSLCLTNPCRKWHSAGDRHLGPMDWWRDLVLGHHINSSIKQYFVADCERGSYRADTGAVGLPWMA